MEQEADLPVRSHEFVKGRQRVMEPGVSRAGEYINFERAGEA